MEFDSRHDVLNDVAHREVAAAIVAFVGETADVGPVPEIPAAAAR